MPRYTLKIAIFLSCIVTALVVAYFAYTHGLWRFNYPTHEQYSVHGLDVSHHQGDIRWNEIPQDRFRFVYIKATEGGDHKDKKFLQNWSEARAAGFKTGAYHFFTLCRKGAEQAANFINSVPKESGALAPVIDLEFVGNCSERPSRGAFLKELQDYVDAVEKHYDAQPVLYTTYQFYRRYLKSAEFESYPLWARDVFREPDASVFPEWKIWQYADNARIPGISGPVDLNALNPHSEF
ncbi:MAG: lysozyme [Alphaproteobacteria bacterium PRO2]|nr:lysozyme [Alphaproteobacteria bacterium PRO2]